MSEPIRAVLVGCGGISGAWLRALREIPGVAVVGLVDLAEEAARKRAEEFGLAEAAIGTDLTAMLSSLHPDAVFDCTVPEAHVPTTLEALRLGCHVLGEKPMADSMENARRVVDAALASGRIYAVIQNRRYHPEVRRIRQLLRSGALGPLTTANSDFYLGAHFGGFRDRMRHVLLLDMAIHTFDAARFMTGADPVSVYCREWNPEGSWYAHGASVVAVFEMTGGLVYTYRGSWCAEGLRTSWESEWRLIGARGTLKWDGGREVAAEQVAETGEFFSRHRPVEVPPFPDAAGTKGHESVIREFVECVRTGAVPETVCTDNIKSLSMVFGAIRSAETGAPVEIAGSEGEENR